MTSRNALIVLSIIVGAIFIMIVVAYVGRGGIDPRTFDKGQRFTAKPGTTRENAILLTSDKRPESPDPVGIARPADEVEDASPLDVKSLSNSGSSLRTGPAQEQVVAARNHLSPSAGLQMLNVALESNREGDQAALLYEAQGQLYARLDPPDYAKSEAAFERALEMTVDPELEAEILYESVQTLMAAGQDEKAAEALRGPMAVELPARAIGYKLQLLQGQLHERAGAFHAAEEAYQAVLNAMQERPLKLQEDATAGLMRHAGLRLVSLYRTLDRGEAADELSRKLKFQLSRMGTY